MIVRQQAERKNTMIVLFKRLTAWWLAAAAVLFPLLTAGILPGADAQQPASEKGDRLTNKLSPSVQMQFMRPGQLEAAARKFPVVYVPFGLIEWHGKHLPLGNDALKAHAILVKSAEQFGGVVYPPVYFHEGFGKKELVPVLSTLFARLKATGFRVIIGVSGHNVPQQTAMINEALAPVVADGTIAGVGLWEITLSQGPESSTDHAAKWETSNMMFFYPDLVDMAALGTGPLAPGGKPPDGIGGLDPRVHASAAVGRRNVELATEAIGKKARQLLDSLPADQRAFRLKSITPGEWWMD
jgi:creatinine amidohydrolase